MANSENEKLLKEIRDNLTYGLRAWGDIREEAKTDMRYVSGDPWDPKEKKARKDAMRPALVLDELNQYINQVVNDLRSKKTGIKVVPTASSIPGENPELAGVEKLAEFRGDLIRQIEYKSSAQQAYITSFENAVQRSYGWHRVKKRYVTEKSFEQELEIRRIPNPDTILPDPAFKEADASDMKWCFAMDYVPRKEFKQSWPNAKIQDFSDQHGSIRFFFVHKGDYSLPHLNNIQPAVLLQNLRLSSLSGSYNGLVVTETGNIHRENFRQVGVAYSFMLSRGFYQVGRYKLGRTFAGELSPNPDSYKIRIISFILYLLFQFLLVGSLNGPGVNLPAIPAVLAFPEAFKEPAIRASGISKGNPDNFGVLVGQGAFCYLPNVLGDGAGFIENQNKPLPLVVQSCERLGIPLRPGNAVTPPSPLFWSIVSDGLSFYFPPVFIQGKADPLADLRPSFCF